MLFGVNQIGAQQPANVYKKVVLQAFWWDYWNNNYPNAWANYLTDLAPRLKTMGIDAVWIPGDVKQSGLNSNGYSPFDHYDLGDKLQRSISNGELSVRTKMGTKDELLRMIAVMHANGIEVITDAVLNHMDGAGNAMNGISGKDDNSTSVISNGGFKNFRYVSYETPVNFTLPNFAAKDDYNQNDYWSRRGRWFKNYPNFHLHAGHWDTNSDMTLTAWGPDVCYGWDGGSAGYGQSSNISGAGTYNPTQGNTYMRTEAGNWTKWYKKQTGVDGFRLDAVKHWSYDVQNDFLYYSMYGSGWANGDNQQFNVGEFVGDIDGYCGTMSGLAGGELRVGTMDFKLRAFSNGGLHGLVTGGGNYDIGSIPGAQQSARFQDYSNPFGGKRVHRSCNFVNSHDTFRPILDASGNYIGWDTGQELYPGHIDPFDNRLSDAYAACFALDGNIIVYFEDLFNIGNTGKRFTHNPTSTTDLPARQDIVNMIWCHRNLDFKNGAYKVRWQDNDYLVVERSNRVLVGINDNWNTWRGQWVGTDLPAGTVLRDYSGANSLATQTVQPGNCSGTSAGPNCVFINTPPVDPFSNPAGRRGYSVWAPQGQENNNVPGPANTITTQEWEMANDLGDSHCSSLGYGGALPANSTRTRVVGKIFVQGGTQITYNSFPEFNNYDTNIGIFNTDGVKLSGAFGVGNIGSTYTPSQSGWYVIKIWNTFNNSPGQKSAVKVSYIAPAVASAVTNTNLETQVSIWSGNSPANNSDWNDCRNWEEGKIPNQNLDVIIPANAAPFPMTSTIGSTSMTIKNLTIEAGAQMPLAANFNLYVRGNIYNKNISATPTVIGGKVILEGTALQTINGNNQFNKLEINNGSNVELKNNNEALTEVTFTNGKMILGDFDMKLLNNCAVYNTNGFRYFVTKDVNTAGGSLIRKVNPNNTYVDFPVGTIAGLTNATLQQNTSGNSEYFKVRVFSNLYQNGNAGAQLPTAPNVNKSWEIKPENTATAVNANVILVWNAADNGASFVQSNAYMAKNAATGGTTPWLAVSATGSVNGTGPYSAQANNITSFSVFGISSTTALLPLTWLNFEAKAIKNEALLTWATANERNVKSFEVMKSLDSKTFTKIATLASKNNTDRNDYNVLDQNFTQSAYYKIVQIDNDGKSEDSQIKYLEQRNTKQIFEISPNPATNIITLSVDKSMEVSEKVSVKMFGVDGSLLIDTQVQVADIQTNINQILPKLTSGMYFIELRYSDQVQVLKLSKI